MMKDLLTCHATHPAHPEVCCYHVMGHTHAHSGWAPTGGYTWGMQHFEVVSQVEHTGSLYLMLDDGQAECVYVCDRRGSLPGQLDWYFELSGLHVGRTLDVWLVNVRLEYDDDGPGSHGTWDALCWFYDNTVMEDAGFLYGYGEALVKIVTDMLKEGD